jgi:CDP-diacylglycerol--glycerol-3-phosphate 3-phosphatidyltransferase/cardiolipin synthase
MTANLISLSRLLMAVAFVHWARSPAIAVAILCLAGISDWLDGFVAKRLGQQSRLGRLLDPICDRLFVVPVLATLVFVHGLPPWQLAVLVSRDLFNSAGALAVWIFRPDLVPELRPRCSGKAVTSLQFWSVVHVVLGLPLFELSLAAVALASAWAFVDYGTELRRLLGGSKSVSTP